MFADATSHQTPLGRRSGSVSFSGDMDLDSTWRMARVLRPHLKSWQCRSPACCVRSRHRNAAHQHMISGSQAHDEGRCVQHNDTNRHHRAQRACHEMLTAISLLPDCVLTHGRRDVHIMADANHATRHDAADLQTSAQSAFPPHPKICAGVARQALLAFRS